MFHLMVDQTGGYRSRLDDTKFVFEFLEEFPLQLGLTAVASPFILPYYNGVVPEDCGISAFVFLKGGHVTFHSFSFHEALFIDIACPSEINGRIAGEYIQRSFPSAHTTYHLSDRNQRQEAKSFHSVDPDKDFGPHLMLDFENVKRAPTIDEIYTLLDTVPIKIGMTPIIRPYVIKTVDSAGAWVSGVTMIAESHISCHFDPIRRRGHLDVFSCRFFDLKSVSEVLNQTLLGKEGLHCYTSRGSLFKDYKSKSVQTRLQSRNWAETVYKT